MTENQDEINAMVALVEAAAGNLAREMSKVGRDLALASKLFQRLAEGFAEDVLPLAQQEQWWRGHDPNDVREFYWACMRYAETLRELAQLVPPDLREEAPPEP